jgi:hypothetical protein
MPPACIRLLAKSIYSTLTDGMIVGNVANYKVANER